MNGMVPDDVFALTGVADPRLSPDAKTVAYVVRAVDAKANDYRGAIWLAPADGAAEPRRFTSGVKHAADPRWSPDGSTIAFVARVPDAAYDEEDDKRRQPRRLTRLQYKLDSVGWTGDRRQHLFVVGADGSGEPVQLTDGDFEDTGPAWSPDGATLAFVSARQPDWDTEPVSDVYLVAAEGGEPRRLTHGGGSIDGVSWAPDGARLAAQRYPGVFDDPKHTQIAVVDAAGGVSELLTTALDRNCGTYPQLREPVWDGDDIVFALEDHGNTHLYRVAADGSRAPELVAGGERTVTGFDAAAGRLVYSADEPTS